MAETKNIDKMAEWISNKIFTELKWNIHPTRDVNWDCCLKTHDKKTHPTDVVFSYIDPYSGVKQYIQTDLKSYCKTSISITRVRNAVKSLALQVECANSSDDWNKLYRLDESKFGLHGLLFIYNNDGDYDRDLLDNLKTLPQYNFSLPAESTVNVFSPRLIRFLLSVVQDIKDRRGIESYESDASVWTKIAEHDECGFYYPDKQNKCADSFTHHPASMPMIMSGMLLYCYEHPVHKKKVLNIFWDEEPNSHHHFIYLFEYIFNYQMLNMFERIFVITPFSTESFTHFDVATKIYKEQYAVTDYQEAKLDKVKLLNYENIKTEIYPHMVGNSEFTVRHLS
ncbi:hypothetical protein L1D32_15845 [Shewanella insulae]|uniref:hypothetical protein n=1 Tax=Shewanella insulae TaxID=2681496 RepID=UPI001EFCEEAA|nr:hypothetical protein [Shewanella insulae]MCG9739636.1 hypothetical protein [Shewanella insulae]